MNDDELKKRLKSWKPELPEAPGFRREVWAAIENREGAISFSALFQASLDFLTRPWIGIPAAALVIGLSAALAVARATSVRDEMLSGLSASYYQAISPLHPR